MCLLPCRRIVKKAWQHLWRRERPILQTVRVNTRPKYFMQKNALKIVEHASCSDQETTIGDCVQRRVITEKLLNANAWCENQPEKWWMIVSLWEISVRSLECLTLPFIVLTFNCVSTFIVFFFLFTNKTLECTACKTLMWAGLYCNIFGIFGYLGYVM